MQHIYNNTTYKKEDAVTLALAKVNDSDDLKINFINMHDWSHMGERNNAVAVYSGEWLAMNTNITTIDLKPQAQEPGISNNHVPIDRKIGSTLEGIKH